MINELSQLNHPSIELDGGGKIILLNTGAVIDPEAEAMLQALNSRSTGGLESHLKELEKKGADGFMNKYYIGYGHKSIGDCGSITIFIEGISMLEVKAIQDNPLYAGQESSTRYLDFSKQHFINPTGTKEGEDILKTEREFYINSIEPTKKFLRERHKKEEGLGIKEYEKAIKLKTFDIVRGLLPAGVSTNCTWHTTMRQVADKLLFLRHHPLPRVREIANKLGELLEQHYPNSFKHKRYELIEEYQEIVAKNYYYHDQNSPEEPVIDFSKINYEEIKKFEEIFHKRPRKAELPKYLGQLGTIEVRFKLDFGSYRDLQRHRSLIQRMPLLTTELNFNNWYIENFSPEIRCDLLKHLEDIETKIKKMNIPIEQKQYFIPMGYNISNRVVGDLSHIIYMVELRDSSSVHPTLRRIAKIIGDAIENKLGIPLHRDTSSQEFSVERASQDIISKERD